MERLQKLEELVRKYPTDKGGHGYLPHYAELLPENCASMLEIGAARGDSLKVWDEFYGKNNIDIHVLDLFINKEFVSSRWCRNQGFVPHTGDQASLTTLARITEQFNLIIDDGSHNSFDQITSFRHLFVNNLAPGGLYVIEDCHCCMDPFYWSHGINCIEDTILGAMEKFLEGGTLSNRFIAEDTEVLESLIKRVEVRCDRKMIFIWKG